MAFGNIKGITIKFEGDTTSLDKALKEINSNTRALDKELKAINKSLKFNPTSVDLWKQKQEVLTQKIKETERKLKALQAAEKELDGSEVDKESAEYRELQREIIETESKLNHFKAQAKELANAKLTALGEQFKAVGSKVKEVGDKVKDIGSDLTTKVTLPLAAAGTVAITKFAEVDKVMQLTNATMGNTKEQADLLNQAMKDAAANSTFGMSDAATATLNFARAGLTAEQAAATLAPAMNLAAGEGGNLDTVSAGLVATINGFHDSFDDAATYADIFANACNNSALDVDSLANAMSIAAPIFSAAGYTVQDAALYMGVLANAGVDANKGANSLKTGLARLVDPTKQGAEAMAELGLYLDTGQTAFENLDGSMKSTTEIQQILNESFSKLSESEQIAAASAIFGKNQMSSWLALINTAPADVQALNESLEQNGTTTEMAASMMGGFGGSLEKLKSSIDVAATSFGEALAPMIQKVSDLIQKLVDWFNQLDPSTQSMIATIALVAAAIGPVLVILGTLIGSIGTIITAIGTLMPALAVLTGPIGLIVVAIAAAIAAMVWLTKNFKKVEAGAKLLWGTITEAFNAIKEGITNALKAVLMKIVSIWTNIHNTIAKTVIRIRMAVTNAFNAVKTTVSNIWTAIKNKISTTIQGAKDKVSSVVDGIKTKVSSVFSSVLSTVKSVWEKVKKAITDPINKAKETVQKAIDKIKSIINGAHLKLPKFKLPHFKINGGKLPWGIGGKGSPPSISVDWYAKGGIFDGASLIGVGEKGPEAVVPLDTLWKKLDKIADASGGDTIQINVYAAPGMDVKALAEEVERRLINSTNRRRLAW